MSTLASEVARRRTFAIISHPDAGKTTLTEKLLLYGGAIQLAGSVKARRNQRKATSDWMDMEKERGISITSTVLQFEYQGYVLNLLDTPGHDDFSADTYRTLTAADSAVMLIDNAKGVETQTKKLFAVCRQRGIPIFTFINKMDHPGNGPLALLTEVEDVLGIRSVPVNWPIGQGDAFRGVYDRLTHRVHLFDRVAHGAERAPTQVMTLDEAAARLSPEEMRTLRDDIDLVDIAGEQFDIDRVLRGELTPVFFGSAITNFGVEPFLEHFLTMAPAPTPRAGIVPEDPFSGFVFKIQANMDPNHRDRIAFMRVVSGKFEKDMQVLHTRSGKTIRLSRPQRLFAQDREIVEEGYAGDVIGLSNVGVFNLGDTVCAERRVEFHEVPTFASEVFAIVHNMDVSRLKHFEKGLMQLTSEGLVDLYLDTRAHKRDMILGVVGRLQFDVVQHRILGEYGVRTSLEPLDYQLVRWLDGSEDALSSIYWGTNGRPVADRDGRPACLLVSERAQLFLEAQNKDVKFLAQPPEKVPA